MLVRALKSFGGSAYGHVPEGHVFELPDGVDWLEAGLVEPVKPQPRSTAKKAPQTAAKTTAKRTTARGGRKTTEK